MAAGIVIDGIYAPLLVKGKEIPYAGIEKLNDPALTYVQHVEAAKKQGFELLAKRATVGQSKHVRVRPLFRNWSLKFSFTVVEDSLTDQVIADVFDIAGRLVGLSDWRPGSKKSPGPYGKFEAQVVPRK